MIEPKWVSEKSAIAIHRRQLAEHGGADGVRDVGLLQSALARPQHFFYYNQVVSLTRLAAAYAFGIAKNHPFIDGNKRTAFVVTRLFLLKNGYMLNATREEKYLTFLSLAEGTLTEDQLAEWLEMKAEQTA